MRKHWKKWIIAVVILGYLAGVTVVAFQRLSRPPDFFSSPTALRNGLAFKDGYLGVLEPAKKSVDQDWPAEAVMAEPARILGDTQEIMLDWQGEKKMVKGTQPPRWAKGLEGDDALELIAFATWMPQPDDDVSDDSDWTAQPVFRDPTSLAELKGKDLDALGVPEAFREVTPAKKYRVPKIRFLFRSKTMDYVRFVDGDAGDQRTGAVVSYNLDDLGEKESMSASIGEWTRMDMALLIWHDTPLKVQFQTLTGIPQVAELEQKSGAQVVFGNQLRVQWLQFFDGNINWERDLDSFSAASSVSEAETKKLAGRLNQNASSDPHLARISLEPTVKDPAPKVLVRASSKDFLQEHCGWFQEDSQTVEWEWDRIGESGQNLLATTPGKPEPGKPMKLVFLPRIAEVTFEIAGLPDQPNPGDMEDLFDIRIPRLTLPDNPDSAEDHLLGMISVATEVDFDIDNVWEEFPAQFPSDRTFRDQTPRELLNWYLRNTPGSRVRYDEVEQQVFFNEERGTWWERVQEWMEDRGWFL